MSELIIRTDNLGKAFGFRRSLFGRMKLSTEAEGATGSLIETSAVGATTSDFGSSFIREIASREVCFRKPQSSSDSSVWAFRHVNLEILAGETILLSGPNGSGKSTFLKVLSGVTIPTEGRGEVYGRIGCLLEVGAGLSLDLTGRENIYFYGAICGVSRSELRRLEGLVAEMSDIGDWLDKPLRYYSSGMFARLAFSVVACTDPDLLILDETLSVLDRTARDLVINELKGRARRGKANLIVAH